MSDKKQILIASDHAGVQLKAFLIQHLPEWNWKDLGPQDEKSVDYPDYAQSLCEKMIQGESQQGILICGSGVGMSIAANKIPGIRAALVENPVSARLSREHNDANVLCLGSRLLAPEYSVEIVKAWLETPFSNDLKHKRRIGKIHSLENEEDQ